MHVIAEITYKCPANCSFCPVKDLDTKPMNIHHFKSALELFSKIPSKRRLLTISGGEPTVLKELKDFVSVARKHGYKVTVVTNCYYPERLLDAKPDFVQISLDSVEHLHDNSRRLALWHKVLEVLEYIKDGRLNGFIRYTLTRENISDLYILSSRLKAMGVNVKIFAMPIRNSPDLEPKKEDILKIIRDGVAALPTRCPAGKGQFVITPDMRVLDCIFHRKELGRLEKFNNEELENIIENGRKLKPYPCGEPYWWSKCQNVPSAGRS